jgi:hypothetical protein
MRGLEEDDLPGVGHYEEAWHAARSILSVRVEGRPDDAEAILRRSGASEIHWTNAKTVGTAGTSQEIVDSGS